MGEPDFRMLNRSAKGKFVLANSLTLANLIAGTTAILLPGGARAVPRSTLILLGALADSVDGSLARSSGKPTDFGAAADSISDVLTCGVAPAVLLARSVDHESRLSRVAPGVYLASSAWRLARYGTGHRRSHVFRGLPVTGAGVVFAVGCQVRLTSRTLTLLALALSAAMVSPISVLSGEAMVRRDGAREIGLPGDDVASRDVDLD